MGGIGRAEKARRRDIETLALQGWRIWMAIRQ